MTRQRLALYSKLILGLLAFGMAVIPSVPDSQRIIDSLVESPVLMEQDEDHVVYNLGDGKRKGEFTPVSPKSKAMMQETGSYQAWGGDGDGTIYYYSNTDESYSWFHGDNTLVVWKGNPSVYTEAGAFISFDIGTALATAYVITDFDFRVDVHSTDLSGDDKVNIYMFVTDNPVGDGAHSSWDSRQDIYDNHVVGEDFVDSPEDYSQFQSTGIQTCDLPDSWIEDHWLPGSDEHITLWLEEKDFEDFESVSLHSEDGVGAIDPTLDIEWEEYDCDSSNISGQDASMLANVTYEFTVYAESTAGNNDIYKVYGAMSYDHANDVIAFSYDEDIDTFAEESGGDYVVLNTGACGVVEAGDRVTATFNFDLDWDWRESTLIDYGIRVITNTNSHDTGYFWDNSNADYENDLHLDSLVVNRVTPNIDVEDGGWVQVTEQLNVTGYYYMEGTATATLYDQLMVDLWIDGTDQGTTYNDTIDSTGFFNISYTTSGSQDFDWSIDVTLDTSSIPSGGGESTSDDNGKNPLFLLSASPPEEFGDTGVTITIAVQPNDVVPVRTIDITIPDLIHGTPWGTPCLSNDAVTTSIWYEGSGTQIDDWVSFQWDIGYPDLVDTLSWDIGINNAPTSMKLYLPARNQTITEILSTTTTSTSSVSISEGYWYQGHITGYIVVDEDATEEYIITIDQLSISFNPSTESYLSSRIRNGTKIYDTVEVRAFQQDINITLSGIPLTYSLVQVENLDACESISDTIDSNGLLVLEGSAKGTYRIVLDTGLTWHDVSLAPVYPDALLGEWQDFDWWANSTQISEMPYPLAAGYYDILIKDAFDQTIVTSNITITDSDDQRLRYSFNVPVYRLSIPSRDDAEYTVELVRLLGGLPLDMKSYYPLTPLFQTEDIRIYGTEAGITYEAHIYDPDDLENALTTISISMPDAAIVTDSVDLVADEIRFEFYDFSYDDEYCYLTVISKDRGSTVYIEEDSTAVAGTGSGLTEDTAFQWTKSDTEGTHTVNVTITKSGFATLNRNHTYVVQKASLILETYDGIKWISDSFVQVILTTNWGNASITITEEASAVTETVYTATGEGTIRWDGDNRGHEVTVTFFVDGGTQNFTLIDRYSYVRAEPTPGGVAQVIKLLEPRDFILPAFFLLGGFALISSVTSRRTKKQQTRKDWRQAYLTQKGVTHSSQLSHYEQRKFHEAEEHRFGKSRLRRKQG